MPISLSPEKLWRQLPSSNQQSENPFIKKWESKANIILNKLSDSSKKRVKKETVKKIQDQHHNIDREECH